VNPRLPRITADELLRALARDGWHQVRPGKHLHLRHPTKPGRVDVPYHSGRTLKPGTLKNIPLQAGLTVDALRDLL
jgi:predicted RNA binding protein YcfA (HicA-like mRNA interferase family)